MPMNIQWGNGLESLADDLFQQLENDKVASPSDVFAQRECVVVPNRVQQAWLQQRFLFDLNRPASATPHVLANVDFPLLNLFVADWLYRMEHPENGIARPDPEQHPFSVKSIRWQLYAFLQSDALDGVFAPLHRYVDAHGAPDPRKCFKLAGRLAALFDQYQTFRPAMVAAWEIGKNTGTDESTAWQPELWRRLVAGKADQTYLAAFRKMDARLGLSRIAQTYRRIFVFAPTLMPGAHLAFFRALGKVLPVNVYLFNPSPVTDWFDRDTQRQRLQAHDSLERADDDFDSDSFDDMHPLLAAYARGSRDLVSGALDLTEGQITDLPQDVPANSVLATLQQSIVDGRPAAETASPMNDDGSIQLHLCHGKMREVEVLRDQLLKCFAERPNLQPRHVQVQAADLNAYAPYIEAVFSTSCPNAPSAIPFVLADRIAGGESQAAEAFRQLLELADSRFAAPELVDLLRCDAVARQFDIEATDVDSIADWLNQAGVRWGRDVGHRESVSKAAFEEQTTWIHGLDRLFLGYALGQDATGPTDISPCDCVEGGGAVLLGRLARFFQRTAAFADFGKFFHAPCEWADELDRLVDDFFVNDNETFMDVAILKKAIRLLRTGIETAGFGKMAPSLLVPVSVIRDFLSGHLAEPAGGTDLNKNAVVFCSLRPGSSTPREIQCLLGMGDSLFPRTESRPAYDLLRTCRKLGDRSQTIEDRMAFLEAILNARHRLLISYPAFSEEDNTPGCESVVVREMTEYLDATFGKKSYRTVLHRLHAFHPDYFAQRAGLFSFSKSNRNAALALRTPVAQSEAPSAAPPTAHPAKSIRLNITELARFFKNPAQYYCNRVLGVRLDAQSEGILADSEPFSPGPLEQFLIRDRIINVLLLDPMPNNAVETLRAQLVSDALLPLGQWGKNWFEGQTNDVESLLDTHWDRIGVLREALRARKAAPAQEHSLQLTVNGIHVTLDGKIPLIQPADADGANGGIALTFRCASPKADVRLGAWLSHLFLHASGQTVASIVVQGKKDGKDVKTHLLETPESANAVESLKALLSLYLDGLRRIPPFTPECALAFAEKEKTSPDSDALEAAKEKWFSGYSTLYNGDADPYFRSKLGAEGPFQEAASFAELARKIMGPMLKAEQSLKPLKA